MHSPNPLYILKILQFQKKNIEGAVTKMWYAFILIYYFHNFVNTWKFIIGNLQPHLIQRGLMDWLQRKGMPFQLEMCKGQVI